MKHTLSIAVALLLSILTSSAQSMRKNQAYEEYIHKYRAIAVEEMKLYHIPASITLAQGLLNRERVKENLHGNRTTILV